LPETITLPVEVFGNLELELIDASIETPTALTPCVYNNKKGKRLACLCNRKKRTKEDFPTTSRQTAPFRFVQTPLFGSV
jgi:hypothetical protein